MSGKISRGIAQCLRLGMAGRLPVNHHAARAQHDDPRRRRKSQRQERYRTRPQSYAGSVFIIAGRAEKVAGADPTACIADRLDLPVGGGVVIEADPAPAFADDCAPTYKTSPGRRHEGCGA